MSKSFDAIIVGSGPVGSIASLLLADRNFNVAIVEKNKHPYPHPRAVGLNGYSLSLIEILLGKLWKDFKFTSAIEVGYMLDKNKMSKPFGLMQPPEINGKLLDFDKYGFLNWFNQPNLEDLLRKKIKQSKNVTTFYNFEALVMWETDKNYLRIQNLSTEEMVMISSKYLIGADGGGSFVRKQIGANLQSLGKSIYFLIVDIEAPRSALKKGMDFDAGGHQIIDPNGQRPTTFLLLSGKNHGSYKNRFRFEFALKDDENFTKLQAPESIKSLVSHYLSPEKIKIERSTVYKFNSMISQKWRSNNIFNIGDAAHQTSPFLGQGLNLGIRNTFNLINKIDLVEKGISKPSLLNKYQQECYPDSKFIIKQSLFMGGLLFNVKPHINLLRRIVYFFNGGRGKPLNLFPAFVPETITIPNGFKPRKANQKGYPMYNYISKKGFPRSLREYMPYNFRVLCNNSSQKIDKLVDKLQKEIRPQIITLSEGSKGEKTSDEVLVSAQRSEDRKMHKKLFNKADYVLMAPGYTMLGTYKSGQENKLVADYKSVFDLVVN